MPVQLQEALQGRGAVAASHSVICTCDAPSALGATSRLASRLGYACVLLPTDSPSPDTRQIGTAALSHSLRNRVDFFFSFFKWRHGKKKKKSHSKTLLSFRLWVSEQEMREGGGMRGKGESSLSQGYIFGVLLVVFCHCAAEIKLCKLMQHYLFQVFKPMLQH